MPDTTIQCPPPEFDRETATLILFAIDPANNLSDISLSTSEIQSINDIIGGILAAHPDVYLVGDGSSINPKTPGQPVPKVPRQPIRFNPDVLKRWHDAIHAAHGRLWHDMTDLERVRAQQLIDALLQAHANAQPNP